MEQSIQHDEMYHWLTILQHKDRSIALYRGWIRGECSPKTSVCDRMRLKKPRNSVDIQKVLQKKSEKIFKKAWNNPNKQFFMNVLFKSQSV